MSIVIHRDRTFTYEGRTFLVLGSNRGEMKPWGYHVCDKETGAMVLDGVFFYDEIREEFPDAYALWLEDDHAR